MIPVCTSRYVTSRRFTVRILKSSLALAAVLLWAGVAAAQAPGGAVIGGSQDALVNGKPAARVGDTTTNGGPVVEGSPNVFINGKPAAIVGGRNGCGGVVAAGSSNVFINGKPVATAGSQTGDCKGH
jgi:uncharacterized Zn-binding protein involved in type VI secretion